MKSPASVCFFCCHELIGTETGDSPEQSRNNGVFHPKKRNVDWEIQRGTAKTDLVSRGSVMYWPEAPALGQFRTRAFICELPAYPWPKGWTHLLWKQIIVFLTRLFKGSGIFHLKRWIAFAAQGSLPSCLVVKGGSILSACLVFGLPSVPFSSSLFSLFARTQRLPRLWGVLTNRDCLEECMFLIRHHVCMHFYETWLFHACSPVPPSINFTCFSYYLTLSKQNLHTHIV